MEAIKALEESSTNDRAELPGSGRRAAPSSQSSRSRLRRGPQRGHIATGRTPGWCRGPAVGGSGLPRGRTLVVVCCNAVNVRGRGFSRDGGSVGGHRARRVAVGGRELAVRAEFIRVPDACRAEQKCEAASESTREKSLSSWGGRRGQQRGRSADLAGPPQSVVRAACRNAHPSAGHSYSFRVRTGYRDSGGPQARSPKSTPRKLSDATPATELGCGIVVIARWLKRRGVGARGAGPENLGYPDYRVIRSDTGVDGNREVGEGEGG